MTTRKHTLALNARMRAAAMPPSSIEDVDDEDDDEEEDWAWSTSEAASKSIAALLGMKRSYCFSCRYRRCCWLK